MHESIQNIRQIELRTGTQDTGDDIMTGIVARDEEHATHLTRSSQNPCLSHSHPHRPMSSQPRHHLGHHDGRCPPHKYTASDANEESCYGDCWKFGAQSWAPKHRYAPGAVAAFERIRLQRGSPQCTFSPILSRVRKTWDTLKQQMIVTSSRTMQQIPFFQTTPLTFRPD